MLKDKFVGDWRLVSFEARLSNGEAIEPYGKKPVGRISYNEDGRMSVQIMGEQHQPFAVADKARSTLEEAAAALKAYEAYFGTYEINESVGEVVHHVEGSLLPNWTGTEQHRFYKFVGNQLILSSDEVPYNGTTLVGVITWEKMNGINSNR